MLAFWAKYLYLHLEPFAESLAEPGQVWIGPTGSEVISMNRHRYLSLMVAEVTSTAFTCLKAICIQELRVGLGPIFSRISRPVKTEI